MKTDLINIHEPRYERTDKAEKFRGILCFYSDERGHHLSVKLANVPSMPIKAATPQFSSQCEG